MWETVKNATCIQRAGLCRPAVRVVVGSPNKNGEDSYRFVRSTQRFQIVKRTHGIATLTLQNKPNSDENPKDSYRFAKSAQRFQIVKRTSGIATLKVSGCSTRETSDGDQRGRPTRETSELSSLSDIESQDEMLEAMETSASELSSLLDNDSDDEFYKAIEADLQVYVSPIRTSLWQID